MANRSMSHIPHPVCHENQSIVATFRPERWSLSAIFLVSLVLTLFTYGLMFRVGVNGAGLGSIGVIALGWVVVVISGALSQCLCTTETENTSPSLSFAIASGVVLSSLSVLGIAELFDVNASIGMAIWGGCVLVLAVVWRKKFVLAQTKRDTEELFAVLCFAVFVVVWCWNSLSSLAEIAISGSVSLWIDSYIHATTILQYGDFRFLSRGNFELVDSVRPLYHYGSYMLPAAILPLVDISGLQAEAALHVPFGLLAMFSGLYALTRLTAEPALARLSAFLSILLLFFLPDTSSYGVANGWFGVRWILLSHPGSGYAIAAVLISLVFARCWLQTRNYISLFASIAFACMVFQLRAHMLLWYGPALAVLFLMSHPRLESTGRHRALVWALALILILAFPLSKIKDYLWLVHVSMEPTGYTGLYEKLVSVAGHKLSAPIGFLLLFAGMLGGLVFVYPALLIAKRRVVGKDTWDWFPLILAISAGVIILFAPVSSMGDPYEFKHRAFVLLYVVTLAWSVELSIRYFSEILTQKVVALGASATIVVFALLALVNPIEFLSLDKPKFNWGKKDYDTAISIDLIASAEFVRRRAEKFDVAIVLPIDVKARLTENATRFASISNVPLYLSRYTLWDASLTKQRLEELEKLESATDYIELKQLMNLNGFRWLVLDSETPPAFDPDYSLSVFRQGSWVVYDFSNHVVK